MDEDFVLPFFHDLGPRSVPVSRTLMLQLASAALNLTITQSANYEEDGPGYLSIIQIHVPPEVNIPHLLTKDFSGEYCSTKEAAMESASHNALIYMQTVKVIIIDDLNYANLVKCRKDLSQARAWSDMFQHSTTRQKKKLVSLEKDLVKCRAELAQARSSSHIFHHEIIRQGQELAALKKELSCLKEESAQHQTVVSHLAQELMQINEGTRDIIGSNSNRSNTPPTNLHKDRATHARRALFR